MQTQQQEQRRLLIDRVLRLDPATYLFSGLGANVGLIESEIDRQIRQGALDWSAYDVQNIHRVALAKAQSGALCANPRYVEAFQVAFSGDAAQKSGIGANEAMILKELSTRGIDCTPENILSIVGELWDALADNNTYTQQQTATDKRNAQVATMTGNGAHGFSIVRGPRKFAYERDGRAHDPMHGQAQGFSVGISGPWSRGAGSKSFAEMSNEQVDALYQEWSATETYKNMSVEQLREVVKKNGSTDVFGKNVRVPVVAPDTQDRLSHPATGEPFNQKSLIKFINQAAYNGRDLITRNGRIVPRLRDLFERTVRGELG